MAGPVEPDGLMLTHRGEPTPKACLVGRVGIRTPEGLRRQVYGLLPLTTWIPAQ
jgi:hypothetical protein